MNPKRKNSKFTFENPRLVNWLEFVIKNEDDLEWTDRFDLFRSMCLAMEEIDNSITNQFQLQNFAWQKKNKLY